MLSGCCLMVVANSASFWIGWVEFSYCSFSLSTQNIVFFWRQPETRQQVFHGGKILFGWQKFPVMTRSVNGLQFFIFLRLNKITSKVTFSSKILEYNNQNTFVKILLFSCSVMSNSLWPPGLQHSRFPCPSLAPGVFSKTHVHWVDDAIQPSHPPSPTSPALNLSQQQGLF